MRSRSASVDAFSKPDITDGADVADAGDAAGSLSTTPRKSARRSLDPIYAVAEEEKEKVSTLV